MKEWEERKEELEKSLNEEIKQKRETTEKELNAQVKEKMKSLSELEASKN
jgi:hypothetical protein